MDNVVIAMALRAMANVFDPITADNSPQSLAPEAVKPAKKAKATVAAVVDAAPSIPAATVAPTVDAATPVATVSPSSASPDLVAPPTTLQAAAEVLKTMVQTQKAGCGRDAAVALLKEFGASMLAQVPAPKLAEFQARALAAINGVVAAAAVDPLAGLVG